MIILSKGVMGAPRDRSLVCLSEFARAIERMCHLETIEQWTMNTLSIEASQYVLRTVLRSMDSIQSKQGCGSRRGHVDPPREKVRRTVTQKAVGTLGGSLAGLD